MTAKYPGPNTWIGCFKMIEVDMDDAINILVLFVWMRRS